MNYKLIYKFNKHIKKMATEINEETLLSDSLDNFIVDNYESSLKHMDSIITKFPESSKKNEYILYREICNLKLGKFDDALKDLDILDKDNNYNKEYTYYLIRGKVLYYLCKFEESKTALNKGLELNKEKEYLFKEWIKKVEDELK